MELGFICNYTPADLELAEKIGYTTVELFFHVRGRDRVHFPGSVEFFRALRDSPIHVSAVGIHADPHPLSEDPALQRASDDRFKEALDIACEADAPVLFCGSGPHPTQDPDELADRVVAAFSKRLEWVTDAGRRLAFLSCHTENSVLSPSMWGRVLPRLKGAGIKYDPSHAAYDGRDYLAELEEWGRWVFHAHAKDVLKIGNRMHGDPNPGFGQIEWGPFFALLYEAGYEGAVVVEPHSELWTSRKREAGLRASFRFLSQFLLD